MLRPREVPITYCAASRRARDRLPQMTHPPPFPILQLLPVIPYADVKETKASARPIASPNPRAKKDNQSKPTVDGSDRRRK